MSNGWAALAEGLDDFRGLRSWTIVTFCSECTARSSCTTAHFSFIGCFLSLTFCNSGTLERDPTMNHLEQLVAEWLQYKNYFVKVCVPVGLRSSRGGFEGELDVVGLNSPNKHLIHVECSLDADSWEIRNEKFAKKFERGRKYINSVFKGWELPEKLDQVALLQFAAPTNLEVGGARLVSGRQFIREVFDGLKDTSPASGAVPSTLPLLRTLQFAADAKDTVSAPEQRLVR